MTDAKLVLVGNDKGGTISVLAMEEDRLRLLSQAAVGVGCSTFAVDGDLVFTAVKEPTPAIITLRVNRENGALAQVSRRETEATFAYLGVFGQVLLGASYHGGWGGTWLVSDGVVGDKVSQFHHRNLHSCVTDPTGTNAYFASLGEDLIAQFSMRPNGVLTPLDEPTLACPAGSGPRHLFVAPDGRNVYLITEFTAEAIRLERSEDGSLEMRESTPVFDPAASLGVSAFGRDPRANHLIWGADVSLADDGRWLLCSERTASTIAAIRLDSSGGLTDDVVFTPTEEQPRGLRVSPDGSRVVVAGERSGAASLYRIDDGALVQLDRIETGLGPNWVRFI